MSNALYHEALVAKARSGAGKGRLSDPQATARLDNPLCGDRVTIDLHLVGGRITAVGHEVKGCLLCEAAAATIAEPAPGKSPDEARALAAAVTRMMKDGVAPAEGPRHFHPRHHGEVPPRLRHAALRRARQGAHRPLGNGLQPACRHPRQDPGMNVEAGNREWRGCPPRLHP